MVTTLQQAAEVFRRWTDPSPPHHSHLFGARFVWNFFRLENEHLNNCGQFRVVRDISIAPVDMTVSLSLLDVLGIRSSASHLG